MNGGRRSGWGPIGTAFWGSAAVLLLAGVAAASEAAGGHGGITAEKLQDLLWRTVNFVVFAGILIYLVASLFKPRNASANPWGATGLEWEIPSPPITLNFETDPIVTEDAYNYAGRARKAGEK